MVRISSVELIIVTLLKLTFSVCLDELFPTYQINGKFFSERSPQNCAAQYRFRVLSCNNEPSLLHCFTALESETTLSKGRWEPLPLLLADGVATW